MHKIKNNILFIYLCFFAFPHLKIRLIMKLNSQQNFEVLACDGRDRHGSYVQHYAFIGGCSPADIGAAIRNAEELGRMNVRPMTLQAFLLEQNQDGAKRYTLNQALPISALQFNLLQKNAPYFMSQTPSYELLKIDRNLGFGLVTYFARLKVNQSWKCFKVIASQQVSSSEILQLCKRTLRKYDFQNASG